MVELVAVVVVVVVVRGGLVGDVWRGNDLGGCGAVRVARGCGTVTTMTAEGLHSILK